MKNEDCRYFLFSLTMLFVLVFVVLAIFCGGEIVNEHPYKVIWSISGAFISLVLFSCIGISCFISLVKKIPALCKTEEPKKKNLCIAQTVFKDLKLDGDDAYLFNEKANNIPTEYKNIIILRNKISANDIKLNSENPKEKPNWNFFITQPNTEIEANIFLSDKNGLITLYLCENASVVFKSTDSTSDNQNPEEKESKQ